MINTKKYMYVCVHDACLLQHIAQAFHLIVLLEGCHAWKQEI